MALASLARMLRETFSSRDTKHRDTALVRHCMLSSHTRLCSTVWDRAHVASGERERSSSSQYLWSVEAVVEYPEAPFLEC